MKTLGRSIRGLLRVARDFASQFGLDEHKVAEVFGRAAAKLRAPGLADDPDEPWGIIEVAASELRALGWKVTPLNEEALTTYIGTIPEPDRTIFNEYRSGKPHQVIADLMGLETESVLRSLARTYADLLGNRSRLS